MIPTAGRCPIEIPLADEIRDVRRAAVDGRDAQAHLQRLETALLSLRVVENQHARAPHIELPVPGEDAIEEVAERWPGLADLPGAAPPAADLGARLAARRAVLQAMVQFLTPIAAEATRASRQLHELQHEQAHHLQDPRYTAAVQDLARIGRARDEARDALEPLHNQLAGVDPALTVLHAFTAQLAWVVDVEEDALGIQGWRAASIGLSLLGTLRDCLARTGFEIPIPADIPLPPAPDPARSAALLDWVRGVRGELDALRAVVEAQAAGLRARVAELEETVAHHEAQLQRWLG